MEVKRSSDAIWILSPSTTMPCLLRGTNIEALHDPIVGISIMSEFLMKDLLGNMPLVSTNKLFKSPSGLIFECCWIARAVPVKIDENEVHIDFHIFAILEFELLIGHPLDNFSKKKPSHGSLNKDFWKTASVTHSKIPMAKHYPNHDLFEEVKFVTLFVSLSPSLEPKPCPSSHPNVVLHDGKNSKLILHDKSLRNENSCAMDMLLSTPHSYEEHNHLSLLVYKLFGRMVVDAYVYHKYWKSCRCVVVLTLQLEQ